MRSPTASLVNEPPAAPLDAEQASADARVATLGRLLRGVGAGVLIAAASSFLLQHWQAGNDLERYAGLLVLTALLSVAGFLTGIRLREGKGARTFLALAAGVVPAHFCILGGLVYSQLAWGAGPPPLPAYASWVAPNAGAAIATVLGALAVLAPVTFVSFLALARSRARALTAGYLLLGSVLLLPTREPGAVGTLVALGVAALAVFELRVLRRDLALRTFEGVLVRAMLASPVVLLVLRSALHYEISAFFGAAVFSGAALLLFALSREAQLAARLRRGLERASLVPAAGASLCGAAALESAGLPGPLVLPMAAAPFAGALAVLSAFTAGDGGAYRRGAVWVTLVAAIVGLAEYENALASFWCLGVGIASLAYGYAGRRRLLVAAGAAGALFALAHHVEAAIRLYAWSNWGSLALLGGVVIVAASLLERHHRQWAAQWSSVRRRLARWEY